MTLPKRDQGNRCSYSFIISSCPVHKDLIKCYQVEMRFYLKNKKSQEVRMKKIISSILTESIALMFTVAPALAAYKDDPGIQKREVNQQRRSIRA